MATTVVLLLAWIAPLAVAALELYGAPVVIQHGDTLTVSDLVSSVDDSDRQSLSDLSLPVPVSWHYPTILSTGAVVSAIGSVIDRPFTFSGGTMIYIPPSDSAAAESSFLVSLLNELSSRITVSSERTEVVPTDPIPQLSEASAQHLQFPDVSVTGSQGYVWYRTGDNGLPALFHFELHRFQKVLVAGRDLSPGERLTPDDVRTEVRDVGGGDEGPGDAPVSASDLNHLKVCTGIGSGEIITSGEVVRVYDVQSGSTVKVMIESPPFTLEMDGYAVGPASVGDHMTVRLVQTGKQFDGTLRSGGVVYVEAR